MREPLFVQANGQEIARRRKTKGWSRGDLADKAGHHEREIDRLEQGKMAMPATIRDVAQALDCRYEDLVIPATGIEVSIRAKIAKDPSSSFIGRTEELEALNRLWQSACNGMGNSVLVTGERGIGKTWLIREFMRTLEPSLTLGSLVTCPASGNVLFPFRAMLEQLETQLPDVLRAVEAPFWKNPDLTSPGLIRGANSSGDIGLQMLNILAAYARKRPVLLVFEDIHRASKKSLDLIELIATHNPGALLMICEFRPLEAVRRLREMIENLATSSVKTIKLEAFSREEARRLIQEKWGSSFRVPPWFIEDLLAWSGGTPFNIQLRLDGLKRAGAIKQTPQAVVLLWSRDRIRKTTSEDKEKQVTEFVLGLRPAWQEILKIASIEGKQFHPSIVASVMRCPVDEVEETLLTLRAQYAIVRRLEELTDSPRVELQQWEFSHGIFRDAIQAQIPSDKRIKLSKEVAKALVAALGEESAAVARRLAELFEAGEEWELAARYHQIAAENATRCFDDYAGLDHATHGLLAVARLPASTARDRMELQFNITRGILESATGGFSTKEVVTAYSRAEELSRSLGDKEYLFGSLWGLWVYHLVRAEMPVALGRAEAMISAAEISKNPEELSEAKSAIGLTKLFQGQLATSVSTLNEGLIAYDRITRDPQNLLLRLDPKVTCLSMLSRAHHLMGLSTDAVGMGQKAVAHAEFMKQPYSTAFAKMFLSYVHYFRGDMGPSVSTGKASAELAADQGLHQVQAWAELSYWRALGDHKEHRKESLTAMKQTLGWLQSVNAWICYPQFVSMLAEVLVLTEEFEEALRELDRSIELSQSSGNTDYLAELLRMKGQIICRRSSHEKPEAEHLFERATQLATEQGATAQKIRALASSLALQFGTKRDRRYRKELGEIMSTIPQNERSGEVLLAREMLNSKTAYVGSKTEEWWERLLSHR